MVPDPNTQESTWLTGADGTIDLREKVIALSLSCVECGYDLRGAPAAGQCAECGASIAEALSHAIDPVAHRLPSLAAPRAVGDGLVAAVGAMTAGILLPFVGLLLLIGFGAFMRDASAPTSTIASLELTSLTATVVVLVAGMAACWCLRPREGGPMHAAARRAVVFLAIGLAVLVVGLLLLFQSLTMPGLVIVAVECIGTGLVIALLGLGRVLTEAGRRSRLFRTSTLNKQRIGPVLLATVLSMALFASLWAAIQLDLADANFALGVFWLVVTVMVVVGLIYLLVNVWWIRSDLHRPPPRLRELVE